MRILKPVVIALLATLAVMGGIVVTAVAALATVAYFVSRRLFGSSRAPLSTPPRPPSAARRGSLDAIDISATEVKSEPHEIKQ